MQLTNVVLILCATQACKGFLFGIEKSFDLSKFRGPIPTDEDVYRNVSQLISSRGYQCDEHFVLTKDKFILNIQRIPRGRKESHTGKDNSKPVVLLQHGLLADSACWVFDFPRTSLAYILADGGYDVWLGNSRGNRYSRRNKRFSPHCWKFWKWSFDEMAKYDLPATVDYILQTTGQDQLIYIAHSQGTLVSFAALSNNKELAKKIKLFIALAPIAFIGSITIPSVKILADAVTVIDHVAPLVDAPFLRGDIWRREYLHKGFCNGLDQEKACYKIGAFLFGDDPNNINLTRIPVFLNNFPSGTSFRNMVHFAQLVVTGNCQMFDYGIVGNFFHYGQANPPQYNVSNIEVPIAIFSGNHDTLSDPVDVELLISKLKNLVYLKKLEQFNHFDFLTGVNADVILYPDVIRLCHEYSNSFKKE